MPHALPDPVIVEFPLRGEGWMAVTTPAERVPSHGVDALGQRYAYDFLKVDDRGSFHRAGALRGALIGVSTRECYAWGETVRAPFDAEVVAAVDGMPERTWIHPVVEVVRQLWMGVTFRPSRLTSVTGNYVLLRSGNVFAGLVHLAPGSVAVAAGETVAAGAVLGRIGHTGNSTSPHLHFQLMDSAELSAAKGIACAFRRYEVAGERGWRAVSDGVPGRRERLRSTAMRRDAAGHPGEGGERL